MKTDLIGRPVETLDTPVLLIDAALLEHNLPSIIAGANRDLADVQRWLGELTIPRVDSLVTAKDAPHFHYRPVNSRDRNAGSSCENGSRTTAATVSRMRTSG